MANALRTWRNAGSRMMICLACARKASKQGSTCCKDKDTGMYSSQAVLGAAKSHGQGIPYDTFRK